MAPKTLAFFFGKAKTAEEKTQSDESMRGSTGNTTRENKPGEIAGEGSVCTPAKSGLETSSITRPSPSAQTITSNGGKRCHMKRKLDVSPNVSPGQASKALSDSPSAASASRQGDKRRKCVEKARQKKRTVLSDSESDRDGPNFRADDDEEEEEEEEEEGDDGSEWGSADENDDGSEESESMQDEFDELADESESEDEEAESPRKQKPTRPKKGSSEKKRSPENRGLKANAPSLSAKRKLALLEDCGNSVSASVQTKSIGSLTKDLSGESLRFSNRYCDPQYKFLHDRKDANGNKPGHPDFNANTLYVPESFKKSLSPGQKQWWEFTAANYGSVLFFKMGKFYELYEWDAHTGHQELGLEYMKGEQPHCGFPEANYSRNAETLARRGYRVVVVEQVETPQMLAERKKKGSKDKVVKREKCAVLTCGTIVDPDMLVSTPDAAVLLAVCEKDGQIGVCGVDVSTADIRLVQEEDDVTWSTLRSLLSEMRPCEILLQDREESAQVEKIVKTMCPTKRVVMVRPAAGFWSPERLRNEMKKYHADGNLPDVLEQTIANKPLAAAAFSACICYFQEALIDKHVMSNAKLSTSVAGHESETVQLDASAIENLEIFQNSQGGCKGTLFQVLDHCASPYGRRLLRKWVSRPLARCEAIRRRQEAIRELKTNDVLSNIVSRTTKKLRMIPDLERLLTRLTSGNSGRQQANVVLYEDANRQRLKPFLAMLKGLVVIKTMVHEFMKHQGEIDSQLLKELLTPGLGMPQFQAELEFFETSFDWSDAAENGRIIPSVKGTSKSYDESMSQIESLESELADHLESLKSEMGIDDLRYVTTNKDKYQVEIPEKFLKKLPSDFEVTGKIKGYKRFYTPTIKEILAQMARMEDERESALTTVLTDLIGKFCTSARMWSKVVENIASVDALSSLAIASLSLGSEVCSPELVERSSVPSPFLEATGLGHPCASSSIAGSFSSHFVPNDIVLGSDENPSQRAILLEGPNMGGKSTILRQVCLATIMAQIGSDVPAKSLRMTPVDKIFVRMGARDSITGGQSTFLVELSEAASVLQSATEHSLVAMDELGRGTATADGEAIAYSVFDYLASTTQCRLLFSTHYHRLSEDVKHRADVQVFHMGCKVQKTESGLEQVVFLYKLLQGGCPKSYGLNVAKLAGLPTIVLERAMVITRRAEEQDEDDDDHNHHHQSVGEAHES